MSVLELLCRMMFATPQPAGGGRVTCVRVTGDLVWYEYQAAEACSTAGVYIEASEPVDRLIERWRGVPELQDLARKVLMLEATLTAHLRPLTAAVSVGIESCSMMTDAPSAATTSGARSSCSWRSSSLWLGCCSLGSC